MKFTSSLAVAASLLSVAQAVAVPKEADKTVTVTKYAKTSTKVVTETYTAPGTCSASKSSSKSTSHSTSYSTSHSTSHSTSNSVSKSSSTSIVTTAPTTTSSASSTSSAVSYPSTTYPTKPAYPICTSTSKFAKVSTSHSRLFDFNGTGKAEYFAGTNIWFASHILSDSDLDIMFSRVKESQLQVVRVWGFGSVNTDPGPGTVFFQTLNSTGVYINYAANGMPRLDAVVSTAEKYGLKLVFPFVNNWSDLGGIASYNAAFGGNATTWYTDARSQKVYKEWVKLLVQRYKCSPAIFAWELGNEPRCKGCDTSVIYNWATEISQYIKSLDSKHLVTLGDEGWFAPADNIGDGSYAYSGTEGVDFVKNLGIKTLDYGTFHLYPESWGYNYTWGSEWILQHDAAGAAANKPVVFEEYGVPFPHNHTGLVQPWQETTLASGVAFDQFWQFATNGLSTGDSGYDVNSIWYNDTEYQVLVRDHAAAMLDKLV